MMWLEAPSDRRRSICPSALALVTISELAVALMNAICETSNVWVRRTR